MTNDEKTERLDALLAMFEEAIDNADENDLEMVRADSESIQVSAQRFREIVNSAASEVGRKRFEAAKAALREPSMTSRRDLSSISRDDLLAMLQKHASNDGSSEQSITLAARLGKGDISDDELRSMVDDLLSLSDAKH